MAHATSRHGAERMFRSELTQTILGGVQQSLAQMDPQQRQVCSSFFSFSFNIFQFELLKTIMAAIGAGAKYGKTLPFSREQESEADHVGLLYMARAGYDPREAVGFWQRMNEQAGKGSPPEFLSSHPSHQTRIEQIEKWMKQAVDEYNQYGQAA